jgi:PAS domain S-box-containing protein
MGAEGSEVGHSGSPSITGELFQQLVESISAVTYVLRFGRPHEPPIYMSPQCERVLGLPRETVMVDAASRNQLLHPDDRVRVWEHAVKIDATGGDWEEDYRLKMPDGTFKWVHDQARIMHTGDGEPALWFGVLTDLTRTNEAGNALAASEQRYQALVERIPAAVYIETVEERPVSLYVSPYSERISGYRPEEWIADPELLTRVVHPDDRHLMQHDWPRDLGAPDESTLEYRIIHRDGHTVWIRDNAQLVRADDGTPLYWQGVALDVTDHMLAEERLRHSEARYRALIEELPAYVYIATDDPDPVMTYVSPQTLEMIGYPSDEWMADQDLWLKATHPDDRASVKAAWEAAVERRATFVSEYRTIRRDGREIWLRDVARRIHETDGEGFFWQGLVQDITENNRAEEELKASELRYRSLVEQVPAVVFIDTNDESPVCTYVSPQSLDVLGHPPEAYMEDASLLFRQIHPEDVDRVQAAWVEAVRREDPFLCDFRLLHPDGRLLMVREAAVLIRGDDDSPLFWQGLIQDLTDRKRAEDELRASETRFRALVERSPAVVYEMGLDDERRTLYVSPQVETLFGYSRQEWLDQPDIWTELLHPDDREIVLAAHDLHNETRAPWRQEYRLIVNDGRAVWVRDQAELIRGESGHGSTWQGIMLDITALKQLEEQLRSSNDELELRVSDRTTELAEANEMMTLEIGERLRAEAELRATQDRYRQLVEEIPAVVYLWRLGETEEEETENYYTSPQIERLLGFTVEEWNDTDRWQQRLHPHDRDRILAAAARSEETGTPFAEEYRLLAKDGHVVWVTDQAAMLSRDPQGKPLHFQGVLLDITARKEAEALEEQFRELLDSSPVVTYVYESAPDEDPPVRFIHVSRQISELIGESVQTLLSDMAVWLRHIHPDDRQQVREESRRSRETGRPWQRTLRVIARDGRVVSVLSVGRCIQRDADGTPRRFVGTLIDVTASTIERDQLEAEHAQLRSLVDGLPGFLWTEVVDAEPGNGRLTFIGPGVQEILGYTAEELLSAGYFDQLIHPDDRDRVNALAVQHDLTEEPWLVEFRARTRDGRTRWLRAQGLANRDENGRLVWNGITFDITKEHEIEEDVTVVPETTQVES